MTVQEVKDQLPSVLVLYNGGLWIAKVMGRKLPFAQVSPFKKFVNNGEKPQTLHTGPVFEFAWATVANAVTNNGTLDCGC